METIIFTPKSIPNLRLVYDKGEDRVYHKHGISAQGTNISLSSLQGRYYLTDSHHNTIYSSHSQRRINQRANTLGIDWK